LSGDHVLGRLDDYVTRSGCVITPIVCWGGRGHVTRPDPAEVSSVHFVSLTDLLTAPRFCVDPHIRPAGHLASPAWLSHPRPDGCSAASVR
jgi:hypothetical protein